MYIFLHPMRGEQMNIGKNLPVTEMEADTEIMMRLPEKSLELVGIFLEARKIFLCIFLFD
jgi:hypothetical protein